MEITLVNIFQIISNQAENIFGEFPPDYKQVGNNSGELPAGL